MGMIIIRKKVINENYKTCRRNTHKYMPIAIIKDFENLFGVEIIGEEQRVNLRNIVRHYLIGDIKRTGGGEYYLSYQTKGQGHGQRSLCTFSFYDI